MGGSCRIRFRRTAARPKSLQPRETEIPDDPGATESEQRSHDHVGEIVATQINPRPTDDRGKHQGEPAEAWFGEPPDLKNIPSL